MGPRSRSTVPQCEAMLLSPSRSSGWRHEGRVNTSCNEPRGSLCATFQPTGRVPWTAVASEARHLFGNGEPQTEGTDAACDCSSEHAGTREDPRKDAKTRT